MSGTVFDYASALLGDLDGKGQALLETYCGICQQELQAQLRPDVDRAAIADRFEIAAALRAAALYQDTMGGPETRLSGFRVGEVSVDCGDGGELRGAALMRRQAELMMARYVAGDEGILLGVQG